MPGIVLQVICCTSRCAYHITGGFGWYINICTVSSRIEFSCCELWSDALDTSTFIDKWYYSISIYVVCAIDYIGLDKSGLIFSYPHYVDHIKNICQHPSTWLDNRRKIYIYIYLMNHIEFYMDAQFFT